jgi:predicted secreted protein
MDGVTDVTRALILPHRAYQVMEEKHTQAFTGVRKYVVGQNAKILSY